MTEFSSNNVAELFYLNSTQRALENTRDTPWSLTSNLSTRRGLKGHSKSTPRALQGQLSTHGTFSLEYLRHEGTGRTLGHSGTQGTSKLGQSST